MTTFDEALEPQPESAWRTFRRGFSLSPELRAGLAGTLGLAVVSMIGRAIVPIAVQMGIDHGLRTNPVRAGVVLEVAVITIAILCITTTCGYLMIRRLYQVSETALANMRVRTFRHIHDLSMLHQQSERRGALVSRVTSDVDTITQFIQESHIMIGHIMCDLVEQSLVYEDDGPQLKHPHERHRG